MHFDLQCGVVTVEGEIGMADHELEQQDECAHCPFRINNTTCQLPIGKKGTPKSPKEHYRKYFGWACHRIGLAELNQERKEEDDGQLPKS